MYIHIYRDEYGSNNEAGKKIMKPEQKVLLGMEKMAVGMNAYWHYIVTVWKKQ